MRRIIASACVLLALLIPATAHAGGSTTHWVDGDGKAAPGDCDAGDAAFSTIQGAVDASGPGDTVMVCPGRYEPVTIKGAIRDDLTLQSVVPWRATIAVETERRARRMFANPIGVAVLGASDVGIHDFRVLAVRGSGCYAEALIAYRQASGVVEGNKLIARAMSGRSCAEARAGVMSVPREADDELVVHGNLVRDFGGAGIEMIDFAEVGLGGLDAFGNTIQRTQPARIRGIGIGLYAFGGAWAHIRDNTVIVADDARLPQGITVDTSVAQVRRNVVSGANLAMFGSAAHGIWAGNTLVGGGRGMLTAFSEGLEIARNRVTGMAREGIRVGEGSEDLRIHDNDFRGNGGTDCIDDTSGSGTAGTDNLWWDNQGDESDPPGICW
ncbi:MAG: right-handed parallel beta-helix repeat-containing protein [Chloroflexota bacterium]|nr:right-handed parallel beta-helix repeat-containing protein [Chloroflexota bacterium]